MIRKNIINTFESITNFSQYLKTGKTQVKFEGRERSQTQGEVSFFHTENYEQANNLFLYGDSELQKKIEDAGVKHTRLKLKGMANKRQIYSAVVGVAPNVPNAIAGIPTSMINVRQVQQKQRVLNLCFTCSTSGGTGTQTIINTSAQFISALMLIEASGTRVNLYLAECSFADSTYVTFLVKIKSASQPFNVLKMCYPMAHPSMLRRHFFRAIEVTKGVPVRFTKGYGAPVSANGLKKILKENTGTKMDYCTGIDECRYMNAEGIAEMIMKGANA